MINIEAISVRLQQYQKFQFLRLHLADTEPLKATVDVEGVKVPVTFSASLQNAFANNINDNMAQLRAELSSLGVTIKEP